jgi:hypothetical protein
VVCTVLRIRDVLGSNLGPETGRTHRFFVLLVKPSRHLSNSFFIDHSIIRLYIVSASCTNHRYSSPATRYRTQISAEHDPRGNAHIEVISPTGWKVSMGHLQPLSRLQQVYYLHRHWLSVGGTQTISDPHRNLIRDSLQKADKLHGG